MIIPPGKELLIVALDETLAFLGRNYGDTTMATLESEHHWTADHNRHLRFKREFSTSLSLPHSWMPSYCEF